MLIELGPVGFTGSLCDMNKAIMPGIGSTAGDAGGGGGGGGGAGSGGPGAGGGPQGPQGPAAGGGGGGGGDSNAAAHSTPPTDEERALAATPGNSPEQRKARQAVVQDQLRNQVNSPPLTEDQVHNAANGVNYGQPVHQIDMSNNPPPPLYTMAYTQGQGGQNPGQPGYVNAPFGDSGTDPKPK